MTLEERRKAELVEQLAEKIQMQGIPLSLFYVFLDIVGHGIDIFRSLDEKYNLVERFGLNRIW